MATQYGTDYALTTRSNRFQAWANLVLGVWLFISPWVLQFGHGSIGGANAMVGTAAWNAWVLGALTFLVALSAINSLDAWQEWITLLFGAWIFVAPWALGFTGLAAASWDHWLTGAAIFLISASALSRGRGVPATTTAAEDVPPVDRPPRL